MVAFYFDTVHKKHSSAPPAALIDRNYSTIMHLTTPNNGIIRIDLAENREILAYVSIWTRPLRGRYEACAKPFFARRTYRTQRTA